MKKSVQNVGFLLNELEIGNDEFEILALVALDIKKTAFWPISDRVKQSICLRPPDSPITSKNKILKNIDQYPFRDALEEVLKC